MTKPLSPYLKTNFTNPRYDPNWIPDSNPVNPVLNDVEKLGAIGNIATSDPSHITILPIDKHGSILFICRIVETASSNEKPSDKRKPIFVSKRNHVFVKVHDHSCTKIASQTYACPQR